ncbi:MAG: hypothetical protein ACE5PM_04960 [Candidatus Hydrothermarchaeales archaeon]
MIPEDFVEYSKRFNVGFLTLLHGDNPHIRIVNFKVSKDTITVDDGDLPEGEVALVFANELYSERSEMAQVVGNLRKDHDQYELTPDKIFWTLSFDINVYPDEIIKRWVRR